MKKTIHNFRFALVAWLAASSPSLQAQITNIWDFNYSGSIVTWTVPNTGYYDVSAYGAQGGGTLVGRPGPHISPIFVEGGLGAAVSGSLLLTEGEVLSILVGGVGGVGVSGGPSISGGGGGGGGSFVVGSSPNPLVVAGGGGGTAQKGASGLNASTNSSGNDASFYKANQQGSGGTDGNGGTIGSDSSEYGGAGGGGFYTDGGTHYGTGIHSGDLFADGGSSYLSGGAGGSGGENTSDGGFGGGGQGGSGGGGGGGYSGGGGGAAGSNDWFTGGGGGSFLAASASNVVMTIGNTGDGFVSIAQALASLLVGNNSSNQSYDISSGANNYYNIFIGCNAGDLSNSVSVVNGGTVVNAANNILVGQNGSDNTMTVSSGASVVNLGSSVIGLNATASDNSLLVTGAGSTWSSGTALLIGSSGSGNNMTVEAGAGVESEGSGVALGYTVGSSGNSLLIDGVGSTLADSADFVVGFSGSSNAVVISNGGNLTNGQHSYGGVIGLNSGAINNSVLVTGNGSAWNNGGDLLVGWGDSGNTLKVSNGGAVTSSQVNYGGAIGFEAGSTGNNIEVTGTGSSWSNSGDLLVGVSGSGNSMVISAGGNISNGQVNYGGVIGFNSASANNSVLVTGTGSSWSNSGDLLVGVSGSGNNMTISAGGNVSNGQVNYGGVIGLTSNSSGNSVLVTGTGSTWSNSGNLTIGDAGEGTLTIANGGSVSANAVIIASQAGSSGTLNFGSLGGSDTAGNFLPPVISFGAGSGTINFNQTDTVAATGFSGNGSVNQLGNGTTILTNSNTYSGTTTVSAGTLLANNTSGSAVGSSTVTVNGGTLGGTGIIATATTIASGGTLAAGADGSGDLTFTGGLSLESGSTTSFTIDSANDFTSIYMVGNTLNYGGQLVFKVGSYNPAAGDVFKVFSLIGGASAIGDFTSVEVGSSYLTGSSGLWSGSNAGATYQFNDVTMSLTVIEATPSLLVGDNVSNQSRSFTGGNNSFYNISIGINAGDSNNSISASNNGTLLQASMDLIAGLGGSGNSMFVSGGALVASGQANYGGVIGLNSTSANNSVVVTGTGSAWNNSGNLTIGYDGSGNSLVISDGASVTTGESIYGGVIGLNASSANNSVLVTGIGSTWNTSGNLTIGDAGEGTLTIANGGSVSANAVIIASQAGSSGTLNFGSLGGSDTAGNFLPPVISFGSGSGAINFNQVDTVAATGFSGNGSLNQLGSGTTILTGNNTYTGTTTINSGTLVVEGQSSLGTSSVTVNGGTLVVSGAFTEFPLVLNSGNMTLTGAESSWNTGTSTPYVGNSSLGVSVVVSNGSSVTSGGLVVLGNDTNSSNNSVVVTGAGSSWNVNATLTVGNLGSDNSLVVSNGGLLVSSVANIGEGSNEEGAAACSNNTVLVTGTNSRWSNSGILTISHGNSSTGSSLTVAKGGSVVTGTLSIAQYEGGASGALNIGRLGTNDKAGTISAETIYLGTGGAINFNQSDTMTMSSSIIGWNAGGVIRQQGSGTTILSGNNSAYDGATIVSAGTLLANSPNALGTSTVTVTNNGTLGGSGTIAGATTIASGGTLAAGSGGVGSLSFNGDLMLEEGSMTLFQLSSTSEFTSINLNGGNVTYGGALVFSLIDFTPLAGDEFDVFNRIGELTTNGSFTSVEVGSSYLSDANGLWSGINAGVTYQFNEATGILAVQAVPEPSTYALLGLAALGMLAALRRRKLVRSDALKNTNPAR